jgi:Ca2+-binding EF-hand superfamily protein
VNINLKCCVMSPQELSKFVTGISAEMIQRVIEYVDADGNGEIDIAELDTAFRLSRWQINEFIEGAFVTWWR